MTAAREKTFLLARPEARALEWIARRLPRFVMPDHLTLLGVLAAVGIAAAYALSNRDPVWLWAASRPAGRALARRLARRHAGARAPQRAAALRLLPRPPGRRGRDRPDRDRPRAVAVHAARDRAGDRGRLPGALDQHLPGDERARRVLARLRAARADRGAARPDRGQHAAGLGDRARGLGRSGWASPCSTWSVSRWRR